MRWLAAGSGPTWPEWASGGILDREHSASMVVLKVALSAVVHFRPARVSMRRRVSYQEPVCILPRSYDEITVASFRILVASVISSGSAA